MPKHTVTYNPDCNKDDAMRRYIRRLNVDANYETGETEIDYGFDAEGGEYLIDVPVIAFYGVEQYDNYRRRGINRQDARNMTILWMERKGHLAVMHGPAY